MSAFQYDRRITAVLGPTNTGKTYLAIERMLGHRTGMIGFPLRLLARENYDKVVRIKGRRRVALVTGEEKIVPPTADYFICTVESMPLDRGCGFLAIDEIQLCADAERGHVFTDRLLHARGDAETMFLGADTIRPIIRRLVPEVQFISRPRFSQLGYTGPRKLARIAPRSAVVAFSANDVYAIAEHIRYQRGGAAVVLGALSPRTRNAQVAMYQAGEVDYLVATDAIGMGLNMDVDHVAFHGLRKFDGRHHRTLAAPEIAQIAGRAGRHMSDGTFGTLADMGPLEPDVVEAVENHRFDALRTVWWRNARLSFDSLKVLLAGLEMPPPAPELIRTRQAGDHRVLAQLARDGEIAALACNPAAVRLLWDVCQIPDFRKTMTEAHTRLLGRIYRHLCGPTGRLPTDWVADQLSHVARSDGDIDTLMARIAHTRTWTYVAHHADWLDDAAHWQERTRAIEDKLSDALHQRLTQRFVDRRSAALIRLRNRKQLLAAVDDDGGVSVEGQFVGCLEGFRFMPDATGTGEDRRMLVAAAKRALNGEIATRLARLETDADEAFALEDDGRISWHGVRVARLAAGPTALSPRVEMLPSEHLSGDLRGRAEARLGRWFGAHLDAVLAPLQALRNAPLTGAARGLAFQLVEALGAVPRRKLGEQATALTAADRKKLRGLGVRLGLETVFQPALLKPRPARLCGILWAVWRSAQTHTPPEPGLVTVRAARGVPWGFYEAVGYRVLGGRAVRVDILDRVAVRLRRAARKGPVTVSPELLSLLGLTAEQIVPVIRALGYREAGNGAGFVFAGGRRSRHDAAAKDGHKRAGAKGAGAGKAGRPGRRQPAKPDPDSPFAKLGALRIP